MFDDVPDPVWKTSSGNWSSSSPAATRSPAAAIRSALSGSRRPSSAFTRAAAALIRPSQRATAGGIGSPEMGKFSIAFRVSGPQSSCRASIFATAIESIRAWTAGLDSADAGVDREVDLPNGAGDDPDGFRLDAATDAGRLRAHLVDTGAQPEPVGAGARGLDPRDCRAVPQEPQDDVC